MKLSNFGHLEYFDVLCLFLAILKPLLHDILT